MATPPNKPLPPLTSAVISPIRQPRTKDPRNTPTNRPMDLNRDAAVKVAPTALYSSTDLQTDTLYDSHHWSVPV